MRLFGRYSVNARPRLSIVAAGLLLALSAVPALAAAPRSYGDEKTGDPARGRDVSGVLSSPYSDFDRDRIYDALERRLTGLGPRERITAIVMLTGPVTAQDVDRLKARYGGFRVNARWTVVDGFSAELTAGQIRALARRSDVVQIEPDRVFHTTMGTAKRWYGVSKAVSDFGVTGDRNGNNKSFTTTDVVACVIDTGIDAGHADLDQGQVIGWADYINGRTAPYDDNGHGSHVAGILAGQGDSNSAYRGVAYGAALVGVKVLNSGGSGSTTTIINGVNFCVNNKATYNIRIISMSLGSDGSSDGTDSLSTAVNNSFTAGILPVVAAGNAGPAAYTIGSPAAAANALTVCSLADPGEKGFFVSSFSSRGPTADGRTKPDICGPGHNVTSVQANSGTGYVTFSGTSMATPFVSGVAALMLDANNALTPTDLKSKITGTADDWRSAGTDIDTGYGRMRAYEAVKSAGGYSGTTPAVPNHYKTDSQTLGGTGRSDYWSFSVSTTGYPIALTNIIPGASSSKDFDLYLYNPSGSLVGRSETTTRQETVTFTPTSTGTYRARVYSYSGSGNYYLDLSYGGSAPSLSSNG